jgi:hypothetical protein
MLIVDAVLDQQAGERGARELRAPGRLKISGLPCLSVTSDA